MTMIPRSPSSLMRRLALEPEYFSYVKVYGDVVPISPDDALYGKTARLNTPGNEFRSYQRLELLYMLQM